MAFADDEAPAAGEAAAYLDDGALPMTTAAMVEDGGQPLAESEISALPEVAAPQVRRSMPPAPEPPSARDVAGKRPARQPALASAQSADEHTARHGNRRLVFTIVASVLGASVVAGGLAGFFVGARGKPWSAILGGKRQPAQTATQAVAPVPPTVADDVEPQTSPPSGNEAKPSGQGVPPVVLAGAETPPPAKKAGAEKPAAPSAPDKKIVAPASAPVAIFNKGVADSASKGSLATLSVTSQPGGAFVWINGKERGRTPLQVKLQSGPARVVLVLAGHASATVDVTAGEGAQVSKQLVAIAPPLSGDARFRAECTTQGKLPIVVDGKETGVLCPFSKLRVDPGVHKIGLFVPALGQVHDKEVTLHSGVRSIVFTD